MAEATPMGRRALLQSAPVFAAAFALPAGTLAPHDPLPSYFAAWEEALDRWADLPDESPESAAALAEAERFEELLCTTSAVTPAGLLAQVDFIRHEHGLGQYVTGNVRDDLDGTLLQTLRDGLAALAN